MHLQYLCKLCVLKLFLNHMDIVPSLKRFNMFSFFFLQDNNGVIGLLEPMKKCTLPVKVPIDVSVEKIASGEVLACFL